MTVAELPYYLTNEERETLSHVTTHPELTQESVGLIIKIFNAIKQ